MIRGPERDFPSRLLRSDARPSLPAVEPRLSLELQHYLVRKCQGVGNIGGYWLGQAMHRSGSPDQARWPSETGPQLLWCSLACQCHVQTGPDVSKIMPDVSAPIPRHVKNPSLDLPFGLIGALQHLGALSSVDRQVGNQAAHALPYPVISFPGKPMD